MRKRLWSSLVKRKGKFVALGMGEKEVTWRDLVFMGTRGTMRKVIAFLFRRPSYKLMSVKPNGNELEQIAELHVKHELSLGHVTRCYDLNENNARTAHKLSESRHTRGKILFQIASLLPERELLKAAVNK
jgi:NADPH:quinone reductase-like Zn-dependent oxidoreductase